MDVEKLIKLFIADQDVADNSRALYERLIRLFFKWVFVNGYNPDGINLPIYLSYKEHLIQSEKSLLTVCSYLRVVKMFYKWTDINGFYDNITLRDNKLRIGYTGYRKKALDEVQLRLLLTSIDQSSIYGLRDYTIIHLMLFTGLRCIEVSRLNVKDVFIECSRYFIRVQGKGHLRKDDEVEISKTDYDNIDRYLTMRDIDDNERPLFISHAGRKRYNRLLPDNIGKMIKSRLVNVGLNDRMITAHSLRHSFAIIVLGYDHDIYHLQARLRHSSISNTQLYTRMHEKELLRKEGIVDMMVEKFDKL